MGSLKIFLYENNRTSTFLEEFYINKFEDLERKIYGYGKDLIICVRTNPLDENTNTTLFQFDAKKTPQMVILILLMIQGDTGLL